jgi:uncharacterized protein
MSTETDQFYPATEVDGVMRDSAEVIQELNDDCQKLEVEKAAMSKRLTELEEEIELQKVANASPFEAEDLDRLFDTATALDIIPAGADLSKVKAQVMEKPARLITVAVNLLTSSAAAPSDGVAVEKQPGMDKDASADPESDEASLWAKMLSPNS